MVVVLAFLILAVVFLIYPIVLGVFGGYVFSYEPSAWADFGTFVGGVSAPVLSTFALIYIANTLKSQEQNVKDQKLLQKIQTLELTIQRHYDGICATLDLPYQNSSNTVWQELKVVSRTKEPSTQHVTVANAILTQIAMFIRSLNYYLEQLKNLDDDTDMANAIRISYVEYLSPKILILGKLVNFDYFPEEQKELLKSYTI